MKCIPMEEVLYVLVWVMDRIIVRQKLMEQKISVDLTMLIQQQLLPSFLKIE